MARFYKGSPFAQTRRFENSGDCIWSLSWCQGNLLTGSLEGTVRQYNIPDKSAKEASFESKRHRVGITSVVSLQDGSTAIACYQDSTIRFIDLFNQQEKETIDAGLLEAYSLSLSPQEDIIVSGNHTGGINVWSMQENHEKVTTFNIGGKQILSTNFSLDSKLIASNIDGSITVFDVSTQQTLYRIEDHELPVRSVCFSADGELFFSAGEDRELSVYDIRTGKSIFTFCHEGMAMCCDVSPDYRHIVSGTSDGKVTLWDMGLRRQMQRFDAHQDVVYSVAFDKNDSGGNKFASGAEDGSVCLFERPVKASS